MPRLLSIRREVLLVLAVVVLLEITVFADTFTGSVIPIFDFISHYNFEAYAWWHDGSFFSPPQWMPYLWGGYPSVSNLQNSSFYLPVGIASLFGPYTLYSAAVVSALHVGFGAVGAYLFARRFGAAWLPSMLAIVAWFFAAGFYSNASHIDISRAYAWLPWILLVASTRWPWRRWWAPLVALVILSQAILGIYPGMIVAILYCTVAWIIAQQLLERPRFTSFLLPLALVSLGAVLTTLVRFLPALLERGSGSGAGDDLSTFPLFSGFGTFLFDYNLPEFGQLAIFMSHALPVGVIALLPFVGRMSRPMVALIPPLAVAVLLGLPFWPWHDLVRALPGLSLSRFMESDFKIVMLFTLTLIAVLALDRVLRPADEADGVLVVVEQPDGWRARLRSPRVLVPAAVLLVAFVAFLWIGIRYEFTLSSVITQLALLAAAGILTLLLVLGRRAGIRAAVATGLIVVSAASGIASAYAVPGLWRNDRVGSELFAFEGQTVDDLLAERVEPGIQRPARLPPPPPEFPQNNLETKWSRGFYTNVPSLYGYVNLRGTQTFEIIRNSVDPGAPAPVDARTFWDVAGIIVESDPVTPPPAEVSYGCSVAGDCGDHLVTEPIGYPAASTIVYHVATTETVSASANEPWYRGWTLTLCPVSGDGDCTQLETFRGDYGQIQFELPAGDWQLTLDYRLPGSDSPGCSSHSGCSSPAG